MAARPNIFRLRRRRGFTLIEAAIVTAIVGFGVVGVMQLLAAGSMANADSAEMSTAVYLANNINEMMQGATYSTLKAAYDDQTYNPPKDACGNNISSLSNWTQVVDVQYVDPALLTSAVPDSQVENTSRVTVYVKHNNVTVYTARWIVASPS